MALEEDLGQSRSEPATPRRREQAREEGRLAYSADLTSGILLLAALGALLWLGPSIANGLRNVVRHDLLNCRATDFSPEQVQDLFAAMFNRGVEIIGVLLGFMVVVGIGASAMQVGFVLTPGLLAFNPERLSPTQGWSRVFSVAATMRGLVAVCKVALVSLVAWWVLRGHIAPIAGLSAAHLPELVQQAWSITLHLGLAVAGALVILGVADYLYKLWSLERSLMMTRQEVKEELKRDEGDPQIKARIRKLQREAAKKRMFQDVPTASVVVTNPTHLAVALRYESSMAAPKVVAKGAGFVAQRIMDVARRHAVPVVERKPLAQALFKAVKIGQEIPAALYYVVAEVLAYVYKLRGIGVK
jgi:flagellar biosynthetic protein FlhB